jgi:hypothetical protein
MSDKFIMGYSRGMGHPVEDALESFLIENTEWILSQDAVVEWCIVEKPWAEAVLFVTPPAEVHGKSDERRSSELLQEINCRLISAGFKTNLPVYARHADGHVMMDYPNRAIEILSTAWVN